MKLLYISWLSTYHRTVLQQRLWQDSFSLCLLGEGGQSPWWKARLRLCFVLLWLWGWEDWGVGRLLTVVIYHIDDSFNDQHQNEECSWRMNNSMKSKMWNWPWPEINIVTQWTTIIALHIVSQNLDCSHYLLSWRP